MMKNVKELTFTKDDFSKMSFLEQSIAGLWVIAVKWRNVWGFEYRDFKMDYEHEGDLKMTVGDWIEFRYIPGEQLYMVWRNYGGNWFYIGQFDEDSIDLMAEAYIQGEKDEATMKDIFADMLYDYNIQEETKRLTARVFTFKEVGRFTKIVEHLSAQSAIAGRKQDEDLGELFRAMAADH